MMLNLFCNNKKNLGGKMKQDVDEREFEERRSGFLRLWWKLDEEIFVVRRLGVYFVIFLKK